MGWQDQEIILGEGLGMGLSASGVSRECSQGLCLYGIKWLSNKQLTQKKKNKPIFFYGFY